MSPTRKPLAEARGFVFDLDGCVWTGDVLVPGAAEVLALLRSQGRGVSLPHQQLARAGGHAPAEARATGRAGRSARSAHAARDPGRGDRRALRAVPVLAIGGPELEQAVVDGGHSLVPIDKFRDAGVVVVGNDFDFSYDRLTAAARAVGRRCGVPHPEHRPAAADGGWRLPARMRRHRRGGGHGGGRAADRRGQAGAAAVRAGPAPDGHRPRRKR